MPRAPAAARARARPAGASGRGALLLPGPAGLPAAAAAAASGRGPAGRGHRRGFRPAHAQMEAERAAAAPPTPESVAAIRNLAHLDAHAESRAAVRDLGGAWGALDAYMLLPVEQYFLPDALTIIRKSRDEFEFRVPELKFFNVMVQPVVDIRVEVLEDEQLVRLRALDCRLNGSPLVQKMELDSKFAIRVETTITWEDGPDAAIRAVTDMDVWCEVVRPFHLVPKRVLEGTCNAVLRPVLRASLNQFIAQLGEDFERWAEDPAYREERRAKGEAPAATT